ncbi:DUF441 domain-containing protein [Peptococcaceae bacterium]|nr:DUF441 domain-containing protein [Peptococcaceae bacterium]
MLTPLITTQQSVEKELLYNMTSLSGIIAIIGGALATHLNQHGLQLLQTEPQIIFGLVLGSIIGIIFFNGQPVGPLMAAGIAATILKHTQILKFFTQLKFT